MKMRKFNTVAYSALAIFAFCTPSIAAGVTNDVSEESIDGGGRNIMRTADGGIVAAYASGKGELIFSRTLDNGNSWDNILLREVAGSVNQTAVDSNFQGSYIAFTEKKDGKTIGRIAFSNAPFGETPNFTLSQSVTPANVEPQDTFIQASRAGWGNLAADNQETVVYGWQDAKTKGLYIGVSPDGKTFPEAQLVLSDAHAASGPSVAIRGNYVIATYQTTNPDIAPMDMTAELRKNRAYPAWIESTDGGKTWSEPKPLFGRTTEAFPTIDVETADGTSVNHRLAGGTALPNSPILNWATSRDNGASGINWGDTDKTAPADGLKRSQASLEEFDPRLGGTTFVQSSMMSVDSNGNQLGEISIVSFRAIEPDAKWTHVIANNPLTADTHKVDAKTSSVNSTGGQFQYSALIDTPVRATTYKELDSASGKSRFVAAVSTDTGKTFDRHISLSSDQLAAHGITNFDENTVFAASQCLYEDRNGDVYIDVFFTQGSEMKFASIPIGVSAADLREEQQAMLSR